MNLVKKYPMTAAATLTITAGAISTNERMEAAEHPTDNAGAEEVMQHLGCRSRHWYRWQ